MTSVPHHENYFSRCDVLNDIACLVRLDAAVGGMRLFGCAARILRRMNICLLECLAHLRGAIFLDVRDQAPDCLRNLEYRDGMLNARFG